LNVASERLQNVRKLIDLESYYVPTLVELDFAAMDVSAISVAAIN
jgi:hypothetical protein